MTAIENLANQVLDRCASTNDIAKYFAEKGLPHGTWVSSRIQEAGRGRLGRQWESGEGNLFLSILVRMDNKNRWSWIPLATAIGAVRFLSQKFPSLNFQVKWPNDILINGKKLGGILCEGTSSGIIIGLGLNCLHSPQALNQDTTSLTEALDCDLTIGTSLADEVRLEIYRSILNEVNHLNLNGPEQIRQSYEVWTAYSFGTEVEWGAQPSVQFGRVHGLGESGELLVTSDSGNALSLFAEDVKVRRKN